MSRGKAPRGKRERQTPVAKDFGLHAVGPRALHLCERIGAHFERHGDAPDCGLCGGIVKTATISFGQAMPEREMARADAACLGTDLLLVLGSSLSVYPAAVFPLMARRAGARLAIVNREETPQDPYADLVLHGEIGPILRAALAAL